LSAVKRILKLSGESIAELPKLTTLTGTYTMNERLRSSRMTIVSAVSALSAYRKEHSEAELPEAMVKQLNMQPILDFMACCALPSFNCQTGQAENGVSCAGCQVAVEESTTAYTMTWPGDMRDMIYSNEGFLRHFTRCEHAQLLWSSSNVGTRLPPKLPYSYRTGGFFNRRD
jgi:hypothetical protein